MTNDDETVLVPLVNLAKEPDRDGMIVAYAAERTRRERLRGALAALTQWATMEGQHTPRCFSRVSDEPDAYARCDCGFAASLSRAQLALVADEDAER